MMVIDASAAASAVREGGEIAEFLQERGEKIVAPDFFGVEAAQVAWKYAHVGLADSKDAATMLQDTVNFVDVFVSDLELTNEALFEAVRLDHSFYDMLYFVLARRTGSPLLTCDKRLAQLCEENGVDCIMASDI